MATLDVVSNGRVDLGIGRSGYPYQMQPYGSDLKDVSGMVEEYLKVIPGAWTEEEFSFEGEYYQIPPREVVPKPVQKPHPPIWQACSQDDTARKVGEQGLGCLAQTSVGPERAEQIIRIYKEAIKDPQPVTKMVYDRVAGNTVALCAENRQKARERGAELIDWYRHQQRLRDAKVWQGYDPNKVPEDYKWHYQRSQGDTVRRDETASIDLVNDGGRFCIGNPDDCIEYIEKVRGHGRRRDDAPLPGRSRQPRGSHGVPPPLRQARRPPLRRQGEEGRRCRCRKLTRRESSPGKADGPRKFPGGRLFSAFRNADSIGE